MTVFYANEISGRNPTTVPKTQADGGVVNGHVRIHRGTVTLASQATTDTIVCAIPNLGDTFLFGVLATDTSLATSTIAIGITGTTGKYRAAAVFTTTNTPTLFGVVAGYTKLTAVETVFLTIAVAALPASGILVVDMYYGGT